MDHARQSPASEEHDGAAPTQQPRQPHNGKIATAANRGWDTAPQQEGRTREGPNHHHVGNETMTPPGDQQADQEAPVAINREEEEGGGEKVPAAAAAETEAPQGGAAAAPQEDARAAEIEDIGRPAPAEKEAPEAEEPVGGEPAAETAAEPQEAAESAEDERLAAAEKDSADTERPAAGPAASEALEERPTSAAASNSGRKTQTAPQAQPQAAPQMERKTVPPAQTKAAAVTKKKKPATATIEAALRMAARAKKGRRSEGEETMGPERTEEEAATAVEAGTGAKAAAETVEAATAGAVAVALPEAFVNTGPEAPIGGTTGAAAAAGVPAAASSDGSVSHSATPHAGPLSPEEREPPAERGQAREGELAASPEPMGPAVIAAVVTAVERRDGQPNGEEHTAAAVFAGTSIADEGTDMQGHGQAAGDSQGPANGSPSGVSKAKPKRKLRVQPAPRRPGAGLGTGAPGPLLGWLLQGQPPRESERRGPSQGDAPALSAAAQTASHAPATGAPNLGGGNGVAQAAAVAPTGAGGVTTAAAVGTRHSARLGAITWGPPRGGRTPWVLAGRGNSVVETTGAARRGQRGVLRGGTRGGRGWRNQAPRAGIAVRTGPWRERHDRPERVIPQAEREQEASDNQGADPEFMAGVEEASEEISLDDETTPRRNNPEPRAREAAAGIPSNTGEPGATATEETDVPSPADLARDDAIWNLAGEWNVDVLQRGDQPFLLPGWLESAAIPAEAHS
ncbi:unnamed protein product [Closterium sp. NIES-64]|nr:unnamed protein product [Closterium sp. NIES-64]